MMTTTNTPDPAYSHESKAAVRASQVPNGDHLRGGPDKALDLKDWLNQRRSILRASQGKEF